MINLHQRIEKVVNRRLNKYEEKLFKPLLFEVNASMFICPEYGHVKNNTPIHNIHTEVIVNRQTFISRLSTDFHYSKWRHFIDWDQFWLIGGSVLKCILSNTWNDINIDLDFFANNISYNEYISAIKEFAKRCSHKGYSVLIQENIDSKQSVNNVYVKFDGEKSSSSELSEYSPQEIESKINGQKWKWQKFQFVWYDSLTKRELMNIIDLDCCQIGFDGANVICTYACLQVSVITSLCFFAILCFFVNK